MSRPIFQVVFSLLLLATVVTAVKIGERCTSNAECPNKAYCKIISPSCGSGMCSCIPGFAYNDVEDRCKRLVKLGQSCTSKEDICSAEFASCKVATCECDDHFKPSGVYGNDKCITTYATKAYNEQCYDSVQCPPATGDSTGMVCMGNRCRCFPGHHQISAYKCREKMAGDSCTADEDCMYAENTRCLGGICGCIPGFKKVQYMKTPTMRANTCIRSGARLIPEGGLCNVTADRNNLLNGWNICVSSFVCTQCDSSTYKCARIVPRLLDTEDNASTKTTVSSALTLLIVAVLAGFG